MRAGELAICDSATNKIHLFSPHMDAIKCISVPFVSIADLAEKNTSSNIRNTAGSTSTSATKVGTTTTATTAAAGSTASPGSSPTKMSADQLRRSGIDYLTYLTECEASTLTFTAAEKDPEYRFQLEKKRKKEATARKSRMEREASARIAQMEEMRSSVKMGGNVEDGLVLGNSTTASAATTTTASSSRVNTAEATIPMVKVIQAIDPPSLPMVVSRSSRSGKGGVLALLTDDGPGSLMSKYSVSLHPPTTPMAGAGRGGGTKDIGADPEALVKKRRKNNRTPSCVCFTAEGQLVVGYKSGGVYVHMAYEVYPMGVLRALQVQYSHCMYTTAVALGL